MTALIAGALPSPSADQSNSSVASSSSRSTDSSIIRWRLRRRRQLERDSARKTSSIPAVPSFVGESYAVPAEEEDYDETEVTVNDNTDPIVFRDAFVATAGRGDDHVVQLMLNEVGSRRALWNSYHSDEGRHLPFLDSSHLDSSESTEIDNRSTESGVGSERESGVNVSMGSCPGEFLDDATFALAIRAAIPSNHFQTIHAILNHIGALSEQPLSSDSSGDGSNKDRLRSVLNCSNQHTGCDALDTAVVYGHVVLVALFLRMGATGHLDTARTIVPDFRSLRKAPVWIPPFHVAVTRGDGDVVRLLMEHGADPHIVPTVTGFAPIHTAADRGHTTVVSTLLDAYAAERLGNEVLPGAKLPADVDAVTIDSHGHTALHKAVAGGHQDVVELLLRHGASQFIPSRDRGWLPIHLAARMLLHNAHKNDALLGAINARTKDSAGLSSLHIASDRGFDSVVSVLLLDDDEFSWSTVAVVDDIEVNALTTDTKGWGPLHLASFHGHNNVVLRLLKVPGVDSSLRTSDRGWTPLHIAAKEGRYEIVTSLLCFGNVNPDLCASCYNGYSALHYGAEHGDEVIVSTLLMFGANVQQETPDRGWTPLHCAAMRGHVDIARKLLISAARSDATTATVNQFTTDQLQFQGTPLHYAVEHGQPEMARFLLDNGARINEATRKINGFGMYQVGSTALQIALERDQTDIVDLLLEYGDLLDLQCNNQINSVLCSFWGRGNMGESFALQKLTLLFLFLRSHGFRLER
jgi:ankyrin repeat protein